MDFISRPPVSGEPNPDYSIASPEIVLNRYQAREQTMLLGKLCCEDHHDAVALARASAVSPSA